MIAGLNWVVDVSFWYCLFVFHIHLWLALNSLLIVSCWTLLIILFVPEWYVFHVIVGCFSIVNLHSSRDAVSPICLFVRLSSVDAGWMPFTVYCDYTRNCWRVFSVFLYGSFASLQSYLQVCSFFCFEYRTSDEAQSWGVGVRDSAA